MTLSSMVVSQDCRETSILQCILGGLHIDVEVEAEPQRARAKLAKSRIDALIVDSQLEGSFTFLNEFEQLKNQNSVPLVILGDLDGRSRVETVHAPFIFQKPISVEQAVRILSSARNTIVDRRLHYHRQSVDTLVSIQTENQRIKAKMLNVSQGGARINGDFSENFSGQLDLSFDLPGGSRQLALQAKVAWANQNGEAGVKFVRATHSTKRDLQLWLERKYFAS
jgi:DNA-binding NtrC family response regulator